MSDRTEDRQAMKAEQYFKAGDNGVPKWADCVGDSIKDIPDKDIAMAIAYYIFLRCGRPLDFTCDRPAERRGGGVFGGWNRLHMHNEGWRVIESACSDDFLKNIKEKFPWVKID